MTTPMTAPTPALHRVLPALQCPLHVTDRPPEPLAAQPGRLVCPSGHAFDVAKQGYVNLAVGRGGPGTGDTPAMVAHRARFLATGAYRPIARAVAAAVLSRLGPGSRGLVVDVAGGTGAYLAAVLEDLPSAVGVCVDLSAAALRRAARAHPRAAAIGADAWAALPVRTGSADAALSIFGPRSGAELARVLAADGLLVTVSPRPAHLRELVDPLGLLGVDPRKAEREADTFAALHLLTDDEIEYRITLDHDDVTAVVGMGPSARHLQAGELAERVAALPATVDVGVAVHVAGYAANPRPGVDRS